jgi:hypothetical protein
MESVTYLRDGAISHGGLDNCGATFECRGMAFLFAVELTETLRDVLYSGGVVGVVVVVVSL